MTEHNLTNPRCPECNGISKKHGFLVTRKGKRQRFNCTECGRDFYSESHPLIRR